MDKTLFEDNLIRFPDRDKLTLKVFSEENGHVMEGVLYEGDDYWYPIIDGVPRLMKGALRANYKEFQEKHNLAVIHTDESGNASDQGQLATNVTFSDKWRRFRNYGLEPDHQEFLFDWYCKKLGMNTVDELKQFYQSKEMILEVGPGSGFNSKFMADNSDGKVFSVDISDAVLTVFENTQETKNCHVIQSDLMDLPFSDGCFDFIMADGVLHHTPDTRKAVETLYKKLKPGGEFFFYVYRKMGAMRQYCDQFIRESFSQLAPEDCYNACEGLTELGRELSRLNATIELKKEIPILGIPAGVHDVQRLIYYNFMKCFWNEAFDFETNNMVNFDWYHPHHAWQHTQKEVESWLLELGPQEYHFNDSNPNGISVLLKK